MDADALAKLARLRSDLPYYVENVLQVRSKDGEIVPMRLNRAQQYLHQRMEKQRAEKGWVRCLVLKSRQQGSSTYTAARFYHHTTMNRGKNTYILAHEQSASDTLFGMVDRFQRHAGAFAPHVGASNAKELEFDRLDSSYSVATAGSRAGGRSKSVNYFHFSEAAFAPNAADHFAASVQSVPLSPGTEIIVESTSNGPSGEFYERCCDAVNGVGDYELIFMPWWYSDEYQREPEPGFELSTEDVEGEMSEAEYADSYGLSLPQMAWRRAKVQELRSPLTFAREYPATVQEAWSASPDHTPFIQPLDVTRARRRPRLEASGPLIIGVDPASGGGDRFAAAAVRGMTCEWVRYRNKLTHEEAVAWVRSLISECHPARVNVDAGNIGANIVLSLKAVSMEIAALVRGVNFGGASQWRMARPHVPGPYNRRAEMWDRLRQWLEMPEGARLPDDDALQADLTSSRAKPRLDNNFLLESKAEMRRRGVRSPDLGDALALCFASSETFRDYDVPQQVRAYGDFTPQVAYSQPMPGPNSWMG